MNKCPKIHQHPFFKSSYLPENPRHKYETEKVEKYLKAGQKIGDYKSEDLVPLIGFPRQEGGSGLRLFYVLCRDCGKQLFTTPCTSICGTSEHTMDDAVLFEIDSDHKKAYRKVKANFSSLKNPSWVRS